MTHFDLRALAVSGFPIYVTATTRAAGPVAECHEVLPSIEWTELVG
jgi:hypothetical protein